MPSPTASHSCSDMVNSQTDRMVAHAMAASPILGLLSPAGRERLAASGSMLSLETGALLCQQGDPGDAIFLLLEGEIEARTASANGRELRYAGFEPPAVVGEMAVLGDGLRATDMIATRRTRLWRIPRAPLIEALHAEPAAAVAMVGELAARLRATSATLEAVRTMDLGARLAQLLLAAAGDKALVPLTQTEIARRLSVSRETVSRKLNKWARLGWVDLASSGVRRARQERLVRPDGHTADRPDEPSCGRDRGHIRPATPTLDASSSLQFRGAKEKTTMSMTTLSIVLAAATLACAAPVAAQSLDDTVIHSMNPDGSDRKTIVTGCHLPMQGLVL